MEIVLKYKKGELYSPDSLNDLPQRTNEYFSQEGLEEWGHPDYEYGTCRCVKSFQITVIIKELH